MIIKEKLSIIRSALLVGAVICACALALSSPAQCAEWRVKPLGIELTESAKTGVVTVINDSAEGLTAEVRALEWVQDAEGKDSYHETGELIFYPKVLTIGAHEERIIRAGVKSARLEREKTYRLYIREIPRRDKASGAKVAIAIQFGIPVFVSPRDPQLRGEIEEAAAVKGIATFVVRNRGNAHFSIRAVTVRGTDTGGQEVFAESQEGWYLLSGAARRYEIPLPAVECRRISKLSIQVDTEAVALRKDVDFDPGQCGL
ncbi:MAG: fimbrial biogenesis chaperone [Thermodesulfovibrionales bacterium]